MVGNNPGANIGDSTQGQSVCGPGMAAPGENRTYSLYTPQEGAFIVNSYGATLGSESNSGNLGMGMFGVLNVQPAGARMYRSKLAEEELRLATTGYTDMGQPVIDYEATYPNVEPWISEGKAGLPILNLLNGNELVHGDIGADRKPAGLGVSYHVHGGRGGQMAEVHASARLLHQQQIPGDADGLGDLRNARQAEPSADGAVVNQASVGEPGIFGMHENRETEGRGVFHGATHDLAV